jgi:hypothetical protein
MRSFTELAAVVSASLRQVRLGDVWQSLGDRE